MTPAFNRNGAIRWKAGTYIDGPCSFWYELPWQETSIRAGVIYVGQGWICGNNGNVQT